MFVQPEKTKLNLVPAYVQLSALNTTDVNPVQYKKAPEPMLVTELGIVTDVRPVHL